jgi:hypothetical protein
MYTQNVTFDNSGSPDAYTVQTVCKRVRIQELDRTVGTLAVFNVYAAASGAPLAQKVQRLGGEEFTHEPTKYMQPGEKPFYVETANVASAVFEAVEE